MGSFRETAKTLIGEDERLDREGFSEKERLFKILSTRGGWRDFPPPFLRELASRLDNIENLTQFIWISEGNRIDRSEFTEAAEQGEIEEAMLRVAITLAALGNRIQGKGKYTEAKIVQLLAFRIQPNQHFTTLPLALTYYHLKNYSEAIPLFESGLDLFKKFEENNEWMEELGLSEKDFGFKFNQEELGKIYREIYQECVEKNSGAKS